MTMLEKIGFAALLLGNVLSVPVMFPPLAGLTVLAIGVAVMAWPVIDLLTEVLA